MAQTNSRERINLERLQIRCSKCPVRDSCLPLGLDDVQLEELEYDEQGHEHVLGFHLPGDLMGLDGIYPGRHQCEAIALETATACRFELLVDNEITAIDKHEVWILDREALQAL